MTSTEPATITTEGVTITAVGPDSYRVEGKRVAGYVRAALSIDERGGDEYRNGRVVRVPQAVVTSWFGTRSDPSNPPMIVNGVAYVGHYAMTATGRYVGASIQREPWQDEAPTGAARSILHAIGSAVATLHATDENINAAKLADAEHALETARKALHAAEDAFLAAEDTLAALRAELAG